MTTVHPRALVDMLVQGGVTLRAGAGPKGSTLWATPVAAVTPQLAAAIRSHKPALLRALAPAGPGDATLPPITPTCCALCRHEFVSSPGEHCPWCEAVGGREVAYAPGSAAEHAFLAALERHQSDRHGLSGLDGSSAETGEVPGNSLPTLPSVSPLAGENGAFSREVPGKSLPNPPKATRGKRHGRVEETDSLGSPTQVTLL